jgi:hypothetical protein
MGQLRATYGDALLQAHRDLLRDLQALQAAARGMAPSGADLAACLDQARADLAEHFRFEEENGYLAAVLKRAPHLERAVRHLGEEHGELLRALDELRAAARSGAAGVAARVEEWLQKVRKHERSENVLVQDAFNVDLAAED